MYLSGLIHRERLFDIARRWLADRVHPDDGRIATEIFAFERSITAPSVRALVADLGRALGAGTLRLERVTTKDAVREAIVAAAPPGPRRVQELVERYRRRPEEFFPRTPVYMSVVTDEHGRLFAMIRRKRLRRIADKVSRKVADGLADSIRDAATRLAMDRALAAGVRLDDLVSQPETMAAEFAVAERTVADRFKTMELGLDPRLHRVDDVIGIKVIGTAEEGAWLERALEMRAQTRIRAKEVHDGLYRGTHLLVDLGLPEPGILIDRMRDVDWSFALGRGLVGASLSGDFRRFVETAERTFSVEVILTTFEDLMESEFGHSIHEARIVEQRGHASYTGRIAQNAAHIIEYLLRMAISPTVQVGPVPFKMWGRYLRDTVSDAVARLSYEESPEWLLPAEHNDLRLDL